MNALKGVNRRVIELNSNDSDYFEKAVLYIRQEVHEAPPFILSREAARYLAEYFPKRRKSRAKTFLTFLLGFVIGGAAGVITMLLRG